MQEAEIAGFGASGRNGGWCTAYLAGLEPLLRDPRTRLEATGLQHLMIDAVAETGRVCNALGIDAQVGMAIYTGQFHEADALAACMQSERVDSLWPTVVQDASGEVLGLAWSSAESLREALLTGRGVYHSRRRGR